MRSLPPSLRRRYGGEIVDVLLERAAKARREEGLGAVVRVWSFQIWDLVRSGFHERAAVRRQMSGIRPRARDPLYTTVAREIRLAFRSLWRRPLFAVVAVMTLSLGLGANTAIFTIVYGVLLEPLPYDDPASLVGVWHTAPGRGFGRLAHTSDSYRVYRDETLALEDIGIWTASRASVTALDIPERVDVVFVSDGVFRVLRVQPHLGRVFRSSDTTPGSPRTVVLSHGYWANRFGGDSSVIGRTLRVDGAALEIVGVLPPRFRLLDRNAAFFLPMWLEPFGTAPTVSFDYAAIGRLRPGATIDDANRDLQRMIPLAVERSPPLSRSVSDEWQLGAAVRPLKRDVVGDIGQTLWVLFGAVGLVLLIACANVANLFLVRAEDRHQEFAIRSALGGSRAQIARQFVTESTLLGVIGGAVGIALASVGVGLVAKLSPDLPRINDVTVGPVVIVFALVLSIVSGIAFGFVPLRRRGMNVMASLKASGRGSLGIERQRLRQVLAVSQVAIALVLVVGSGLLVRSFAALHDTHPGFRVDGVLTFQVSIPRSTVPDNDEVVRTHERIIAAVSSIPGVRGVGATTALPIDGRSNTNVIYVEDSQVESGRQLPLRRYKAVTGGYFDTMGIPLLAGRVFDWNEVYQRRPVGLISESLAREHWGDPARALGKRIRHGEDDPWREVIGIVGDVHDDGLDHNPPGIAYWPIIVEDFLGFPWWVRRTLAYVVRSDRDRATLVTDVRRAVASVDGELPLANTRSMQDVLDQSTARTTFTLVLLGIAATMAILLGSVGVYGVISYTVAHRTGEIGIRMALGATRHDVRRLVLHGGGLVALLGIGVGSALAVATTRLLSTLLYGVSPTDPVTYGVAVLSVTVCTLVASYLPARRASSVDPVRALRRA